MTSPETDATAPIPRTPRSQVREKILAAARAEFVECGYGAASVARIARRAGFTKGAVYSNFESKQALLTAMLAERSAAAGRLALATLADEPVDPATLAERAAGVLADGVLAQPQEQLLLAELAHHASIDGAAAAGYAQFRAAQCAAVAGEFATYLPMLGVTGDADLDHAAFVLVTTMSALAVEHAAQPGRVGRELIRSTLATVLRGLLDPLIA